MVYKFIWHGKVTFKRKCLTQMFEKGGLKMLDFGNNVKASKCKLIHKYLNIEGDSCKVAFEYFLSKGILVYYSLEIPPFQFFTK